MSSSSESSKGKLLGSNDANVIQLGFSISVAGKPESDFEIYVNDKKQACGQLPATNLEQITLFPDQSDQKMATNSGSAGDKFKKKSCLDELSETEEDTTESIHPQKTEENPTAGRSLEAEDMMNRSEDLTIVDEIKSAMGNFEKFSEHVREIPRLSTKRIYTSTPYPNRNNSRSEGNLSLYGHVPRSFVPKHDFRDRKYFRKPKPLSSDLFLKPLPAEDYFKKAFVRRYYDFESYQHYSSVDSLPQYYEYGGEYKVAEKITSKSDNDKSDALSSTSDICASETKGSKKGEGSEINDKQSTSSESAKDIKIYQSGGIIIMQNFSENTDLIERKDSVDGTKLIEQCSKLAEKIGNNLNSSDESQRLLLNSSSDEVKGQTGKSVQFDLSSCENTRSKSCDSSSEMPKSDYIHSLKNESYNTKIDCLKIKENSFPVLQNQDFTSLSTQENDSIISNLLGMSPTSSTSGKKLEWDSGADVGYLNLDLTKENISTIERIILKGLSDDGVSKKQVVYQKTEQEPGAKSSKFILERMPSELEIGEVTQNNPILGKTGSNASSIGSRTTKSNTESSRSGNDVAFAPKKWQNPEGSKNEEKFQFVAEGKSNRSKHHARDSKSAHNFKGGKTSKSGKFLEKSRNEAEIPSSITTAGSGEICVQTKNEENVEENPTFSDKSTYVNTLFDDLCLELQLDSISRSEESGRSESSEKCKPHHAESPRIKKFTKKKNSIQGGNLTARLKDKIDTIIDIARQSKNPDTKIQPSNSGTTKSLEQVALNRKVDEFGLQGMKVAEINIVKSDPPSLSSLQKSVNSISKEKVVRSRPISASSSSVRTVEANADAKDTTEVNAVKHFSDQIIQTAELLCESKGIQAFQSAKCSTASSQVEEENSRNVDEIVGDISGIVEMKEIDSENLLLSRSKSIQAPGMNSSLPKHLAHPKLTGMLDQLNTKSTQFFGSSITSLPNYHSNVTGKEMEKVKKSKSKSRSDVESSRIKLENVKNATVKGTAEREVMKESVHNGGSHLKVDDNDDSNKKISGKGTKKNKNDSEDKENFSAGEEQLTDSSKRHSEHSLKDSKESYNQVNGSKKSDSVIFGSCEVQLSDDGRNIFLTSELLKEHGNSIDRNIIQEKYFQSQLLELGRRPMISRSTSMEKKRKFEKNNCKSFSLKTGVTVNCQYSSSITSKSEEILHYPETTDSRREEEVRPKTGWLALDGCNSKRIKDNENKFQTLGSSVEDKDFPLADSFSSGTRTDHSWSPGTQPMSRNQNLAVGRASSFEYLPGHIYENAENSQGKSVAVTEHNANVDNSADSRETGCTSESNVQVKESESGQTLVLENTYRSPLGSDQIKSLDNNLTELEMVVTRLHEKEAVFQRITDSVLSTVSKGNGSRDSTHPSGGESLSNNNSQGAEQLSCEIEIAEGSSQSNGSKPEVNEKCLETKEISTACQTEDLVPDNNQFDEERKKLSQKMNDEKEQQIKWIENEIQHLNMLRSLLEKQEDLRNSTGRKKRHYYLTEAKEGLSAVGTLSQEILRNILRESLPKTMSSGCDSTVEDQLKLEASVPLNLSEDSAGEPIKEFSDSAKSFGQLGMSLSLHPPKNAREVTMLPVGVQVTLRNRKTGSRRDSPVEKNDPVNLEDKSSQNPTVTSLDFIRQTDVGVQASSLNNRLSGSSLTLGSSDSLRRCRCFKCNKSRCSCLKPEFAERRKSSQNRSEQGKGYEQDSNKPARASSTVTSGEFSKSDVKIPEIRDIDNSRGVSTIGTPTPQVSRSRESSKQEHYCISSEGSITFEKCTCSCHAEPLPRCMSCNLLNTCKKCHCYRRIKCCICKSTASRGSLKKKCATISSTCLWSTDFCQMCRCSRAKNQVCALCPCHTTLSLETTCKCKKKFEERSCQTEGKECKCCYCNEKPREADSLYRETKFMAEKQHVTENREPSEMTCPSELKYETEERKPVEEKFPFQMKVPLEKKNCAELKNAMQMKNEMEKRCVCEMQPVGVRELRGKIKCRCEGRNANRKSVEEHPRHYFLEVEETTEEESSESCDNRNSLEVITIKVPIRKMCKGSRNANSSPQRNMRKSVTNKEAGDIFAGESKNLDQKSRATSECNCCEDCIGRSHKHFGERPHNTEDNYRARRTQHGDSKGQQRTQGSRCKCCEDCPGHQNMQAEEQKYQEYAMCDDYERQKCNSISLSKQKTAVAVEDSCDCDNCTRRNSYRPSKYSGNEYDYQEESEFSDECQCCHDCPGRLDEDVKYQPAEISKPKMYSTFPSSYEEEESVQPSAITESPPLVHNRRNSNLPQEKNENGHNGKSVSDKYKKGSSQKPRRTCSSFSKPYQPHRGSKSKDSRGSPEGNKDKNKASDYYNFNKKEYLTKSELEREEKKKKPERLTLQECLTVKRPDLYTRAECRRKIISEKSRGRAERRNKRFECLTKVLPQCDDPGSNTDLKLFTSAQMRKQTRKFYKKLPEVTNKVVEEKKKMQFRTNKLMAEIFAKKLQLQTLKGCMNLSNSFTVMSTM